MNKITFLNQPKITEHEADRARNEMKRELVPKVEGFLSDHDLFKDKEVSVSFAQEGLTSLVSIIEVGGHKYVLKTTLTAKPIEGEGIFLKVWEEDGVSVPHVIEEGILNQRPYILMDFVDAAILSKAYSLEEMISQKIFVELGSTLSKMHARNVKGHGLVHDGRPDSEGSSAWSPKEAAIIKLAYIKEHSILNDEEHGSIAKAIDIIQKHVNSDNRSTYCHNDFSPHNVFATKPLTVFDPSPSFDHPYVDLSMAIVLIISHYDDSKEAVDQLIEGYFGNKTIDPQVLHAFVVFNSHRRIPRWHATDRTQRTARVQEYLKKKRAFIS